MNLIYFSDDSWTIELVTEECIEEYVDLQKMLYEPIKEEKVLRVRESGTEFDIDANELQVRTLPTVIIFSLT